ncbi:DNA N-6-adenine-methyltransferase [Sphingobium rhizovicinum]|uniref:DNA N-6-adenine-methyltransferase n=1 Tax=Sphingobium rhizovicinum TaxID=432308 RepID=A0ABV7NF82_9SPHN
MLLDHLRHTRQSRGLSRAALADALGVSAQSIDRLERGTGSVSLLVRAMACLELHFSGIARGASLPVQLQRKRLQMGWSLDEVARRARVTRKTLAAVENGEGSVASLLKVFEVLGRTARKAEPVRPSWGHDSTGESDKRFTPLAFLDCVTSSFGEIDLDPCGHEDSPVVARRIIMPPECGLAASWHGARLTFVNPPYSQFVRWLDRAIDAWESKETETVVILGPVRTDGRAFQQRVVGRADICLMADRLRFLTSTGIRNPIPTSLMVMIFGGRPEQIDHFATLVPGAWFPRIT